jgi:uncharacterized protein (TIRG00374 family)
MTQPKRSNHTKAIIFLLILGLVAFFVYFYFFINPAQVADTLSHTNLAIYAGAFVAYSLYVLFSSLVWHRLLNNIAVKISVRKTWLYAWVGLFFDAAVPQLGWSAEISKTYLLSKDTKVDPAKIGASVVGQKIFVMTMSIVSLAVGLASILVSYSLPLTVTLLFALVLALSIVTLGIVYWVSIRASATKTLLNWAVRVIMVFRKRWNPENFKNKAEGALGEFHGNISQLAANPRELILPIAFSAASFLFELSVVFLSFMALGYPVRVDQVLIVFTLTGVVQTVAFIGFPEIVMSSSFWALGIAPEIALSATLLARIVSLGFRLIVSGVALQQAGVGIVRKNAVVENP